MASFMSTPVGANPNPPLHVGGGGGGGGEPENPTESHDFDKALTEVLTEALTEELSNVFRKHGRIFEIFRDLREN